MHGFTKRLCALLLLLQMLLLPLTSFAEKKGSPQPGDDILSYCTIRLSSYTNQVKNLTDYDLETAWISSPGGEQAFQILKDIPGEATLSIYWVEKPAYVSLEQRRDGKFYELATFRGADVPDAFDLPEADVSYRLVTKGRMQIAEIRILMGKGQPYAFDRMSEDPNAPVAEAFLMKRGDGNYKVAAMQEKLKAIGYFFGTTNGTYADMTVKAVENFQKAYGLEVTGQIDAYTRDVIDVVYLTWEADPATEAPDAEEVPPKAWKRTASDFVEYIRSKVGQGYVYGAQGEVSNSSFRARKATQYGKYEEAIMKIASKWDGMEVFDCNGLIKSFLEVSEGEFPSEWHTNVTGAVKRWMVETGPIETMPKEPGILVYQQRDDGTGGYMHIGVYTGDGITVHSRGHTYGVVEDPMPYLWTHWGRPSWLTFDMGVEEDLEFPETFLAVGDQAKVETSMGNGLQVYSAPSKKARYALSARIPNLSTITIAEVPEGGEEAHYWRGVTVLDYWGNPIDGYVYAKDLTGVAPLPARKNEPEATPEPTPIPIPTIPPTEEGQPGTPVATPTLVPEITPEPTLEPTPTPTPMPTPEPTPTLEPTLTPMPDPSIEPEMGIEEEEPGLAEDEDEAGAIEDEDEAEVADEENAAAIEEDGVEGTEAETTTTPAEEMATPSPSPEETIAPFPSMEAALTLSQGLVAAARSPLLPEGSAEPEDTEPFGEELDETIDEALYDDLDEAMDEETMLPEVTPLPRGFLRAAYEVQSIK